MHLYMSVIYIQFLSVDELYGIVIIGLTEKQLDSEDVQSPPDPEEEVAVEKEKSVELTTQ